MARKALMGIYCIPFVTILCIHGCAQKLKPSIDTQRVNLYADYGVIYNKGEIVHLRDTIPIYYINDFFIYCLPYTELTRLGDSTQGIKIYNYFLFRNGRQIGYYIFNDTIKSTLKYPVDSILMNHAYTQNFNPYKNNELLPFGEIKHGGSIVKVFLKKNPDLKGMFDSVFCYFRNDLKYLNFSLSKDLDSITQMKLFKIKFAFKESYDSVHKITVPNREIVINFLPDKKIDKRVIEQKFRFLLSRIRINFPQDTLE